MSSKKHNYLRCPKCGAWLDKTEENCPECNVNFNNLSLDLKKDRFKAIRNLFEFPFLLALLAFIIALLFDVDGYILSIFAKNPNMADLLNAASKEKVSLSISAPASFFTTMGKPIFKSILFQYQVYATLIVSALCTLILQLSLSKKYIIKFGIYFAAIISARTIIYCLPILHGFKYGRLFLFALITFLIAASSIFIVNRLFLLLKDGIFSFKNRRIKGGFLKTAVALCLIALVSYIYFHTNDIERVISIRRTNLKYNLNNLYGYIDKSGKIIVEPKYDGAMNFSEGLASVYINSKWGVIDKTGKMVIEPKFGDWVSFKKHLACAYTNSGSVKGLLINHKGKVLLDNLQMCQSFQENEKTNVIEQNNKYGIINDKGQIIIEPKYASANNLLDNNNKVIVCLKKYQKETGFNFKQTEYEECGVIDRKENYIIEPIFQDIKTLNNKNYFAVKKNNKWGIIDNKQKYILKPESENLIPNNNNDWLVYIKDSKYGFVNLSGKKIEAKFDNAKNFSENLAPVMIKGKWGFVNSSGDLVIDPQFNSAEEFAHGSAIVVQDNKYGLIDKTGKFVLPLEYTSLQKLYDTFNSEVSNNVIAVKDSKAGIVTRRGDVLVEFQFEAIEKIKPALVKNVQSLKEFNDYFKGKQNSKWCLIDHNGQAITKAEFDEIGWASEKDKLFSVEKDSKYSLMNENGEIISKDKFDKISYFTEGLAKVKLNDKWGYIDLTGKVVIEPQFKEVYGFSEGLSKVAIEKTDWLNKLLQLLPAFRAGGGAGI